MREQGTHWALGSLCSLPNIPAFPKSACAASLPCSVACFYPSSGTGTSMAVLLCPLHTPSLQPRSLHCTQQSLCTSASVTPGGNAQLQHPQGWNITLSCRAAQGALALQPWAWSQALLKELQFPGQVSGCPDPGLSSSGAAVPWLQPAVPQGVHPSRLLPHRLMPRQGELFNSDSSRNPKLVSIPVYLYFLIQSPWCQN